MTGRSCGAQEVACCWRGRDWAVAQDALLEEGADQLLALEQRGLAARSPAGRIAMHGLLQSLGAHYGDVEGWTLCCGRVRGAGYFLQLKGPCLLFLKGQLAGALKDKPCMRAQEFDRAFLCTWQEYVLPRDSSAVLGCAGVRVLRICTRAPWHPLRCWWRLPPLHAFPELRCLMITAPEEPAWVSCSLLSARCKGHMLHAGMLLRMPLQLAAGVTHNLRPGAGCHLQPSLACCACRLSGGSGLCT